MNKLPSAFQRGDTVNVLFPDNALLKDCTVIKVSFPLKGEPLYDVQVPFRYYLECAGKESVKGYARIHSLKEWHLRNPESGIADIITSADVHKGLVDVFPYDDDLIK